MVFNLFPTNKEVEQAQIYTNQYPGTEDDLINTGNWLQKRAITNSYLGGDRPTYGQNVASQSPEFSEAFKDWVGKRDAVGDWAGQQLSNLRQGSSNSGGNRAQRDNVTPTEDSVVVEPDPVTPPTVSTSASTASSTPGDYVIQKGDTLWDLTGGDQEKIKELARINDIKDVNLILAGATLKTPSMDYLNRQLGG